MARKLRIIVLFGGRSGEHEVSINSAASVLEALDRKKYHVIPVAITRDGKWLAGVAPHQMAAGINPAEMGSEVFLPADPGYKGMAVVGQCDNYVEVDAVIPVLHGTYGEDGAVQGLLELADIPYVGSGVLGSALGMDKVIMKTVLAQHGLPQVNFWHCLRVDWERDPGRVTAAIEEKLGYPCFIKPANLGSSVGISKAHNRRELVRGMDTAATYDRKIIIEEFIDAREVEVGVLGNHDPAASLPGEIVPHKEFYDYESKYIDGFSSLIIPADLHRDMVYRFQNLAVKVFKALDCAGLARVDFFIRKSDGEMFVNEINTIPGFTKFSMYPKLWEASGIEYNQLLDRLIEFAMERHHEKKRCKTTFECPGR